MKTRYVILSVIAILCLVTVIYVFGVKDTEQRANRIAKFSCNYCGYVEPTDHDFELTASVIQGWNVMYIECDGKYYIEYNSRHEVQDKWGNWHRVDKPEVNCWKTWS